MKYLGSKNIITERLELKAQTFDEQKYLWSLLVNEELNKYFLTSPKKLINKLKDWNIQEDFYREKIKKANNKDVFEWSIFLKNTNTCIGRISCQEGKSEDENIRDVGWIIDSKYHKKGYGKEAAIGMLDYMFNECDIQGIKTSAAVVNPSSWKLMEKLGMKREEKTIYNQYTYIDGLTECYSYYLDKEMYNKKRNERNN